MGKFKKMFVAKLKMAAEEMRYRGDMKQRISDALEEINQLSLGDKHEINAVIESGNAMHIKVTLSCFGKMPQIFWIRIDETITPQGHARYSFNFYNKDYPILEEALESLASQIAFAFAEKGGTLP